MKILIISHMYPSKTNDNYGIFVHEQVKELIKQGNEVKVISPVPFIPKVFGYLCSRWKMYTEIPKRDKINGVDVYYPRYLDFPKNLFLSFSGWFMSLGIRRTFKRLNKKYNFDLIHSHVLIPDSYAAMLVNKKYNLPHIVTVHGQDFEYTISFSKLCRIRMFEVMKKVDAIITVSSKLKNIIKDNKICDKIYIVNNGVSLNQFKYKEKDFESNSIISVSNLIETKGIDLNIKVVSKLKKKYNDIRYFIVGDGPERKKLMALVEKLELKDNVCFLGKLSHKDVSNILEKPYIFSLPSWDEGFGVSYIEAMASGNPVIGVLGEGINDVIVNGKNGFLVRPKNENDLFNAIDKLLSCKKLAKSVGIEGRKTVLREYTWRKKVEEIYDIYEEIVNDINKNVNIMV